MNELEKKYRCVVALVDAFIDLSPDIVTSDEIKKEVLEFINSYIVRRGKKDIGDNAMINAIYCPTDFQIDPKEYERFRDEKTA